jgi:predicted adenine nucleotide alpha hydrolase (AANH) superfamily ATPase
VPCQERAARRPLGQPKAAQQGADGQVSRSRTEFFVNAKKTEWAALEKGKVCEITFDARADEAAKVECEN